MNRRNSNNKVLNIESYQVIEDAIIDLFMDIKIRKLEEVRSIITY